MTGLTEQCDNLTHYLPRKDSNVLSLIWEDEEEEAVGAVLVSNEMFWL